MFFDTHAHYDDPRFEEDRDELITSLRGKGVVGVISCGCDAASNITTLALADKYDFIYAGVGIHPQECGKSKAADFDELKNLAKNKKVVAIGEIGLDYKYEYAPRDVQKQSFYNQLLIANELKLPVIIHERDAFSDCLDIIKAALPEYGGSMHSFAGNTETVKLVLNLGMYIGFSGMITFKNNVKTVEMCPLVPDDRMLIETDCPYLSPVPMRGKRNDSSLLCYTAERIAQIRKVSIDEVEKITTGNAHKLFNITP
ncbi:MAG: TatD family hydrolase [Bacillota bacterium]|nr:TatD family hydrolase [Bacillota bacterium]